MVSVCGGCNGRISDRRIPHVQSRTKSRIGLPAQQVRAPETGCRSQLFSAMGHSALAVSTAVPIPMPTSMLFAAAGASDYGVVRFLTVVIICRSARYIFIAIIADHYGRHFVRALRHPSQYWGWLLLSAAVIVSLIMAGIVLNKRLAAPTST